MIAGYRPQGEGEMYLLSLVAALAWATETPPTSHADAAPYWSLPPRVGAYERNMEVARAGVIVTAVGFPLAASGGVLLGHGYLGGSAPALGLGLLATSAGVAGALSGPIVLMVAETGAVRALRAAGTPVVPGYSIAGVACYGVAVGALVLAVFPPERAPADGFYSGVVSLSAYGAASVLFIAEYAHLVSVGRDSLPAASARPDVRLVPWVVGDRVGLTLALTR